MAYLPMETKMTGSMPSMHGIHITQTVDFQFRDSDRNLIPSSKVP